MMMRGVLWLALSLVAFDAASSAVSPSFTWEDVAGNKRSASELERRLAAHLKFLTQTDKHLLGEGPEPDQSLRLNLDGAKLVGLKITDANLMLSSLQDADLEAASLIRANFVDSNLYDAFLRRAVLDGSDLRGAEMFNARLMNASLRNVDLSGTNLEEADVDYADFKGAIYEPKRHPNTEQMARALNLSSLTYKRDPTPLTELKKRFKDNGFLRQYKEVVAALRRTEGGFLGFFLFDVTCEYGSNPLRALYVMVLLVPVFSVLYLTALSSRSAAGIYLLYSGARINTGNERLRVKKLVTRPMGLKHRLVDIRTALTFSFLSAFNFGFKEVQIGQWFRLVQPREFDLKARGWPRTAAAVQSLIGFYLLGLCILSYFSAPFDW